MNIKKKLSNYIKPLDAIVLGLIIVLRTGYFHFCNSVCRTVDSAEYIRVNGLSWITGDIDRYRLPVYPLFIDVCRKLFGDGYLEAVCVIQLLVSILSLVALYFTLRKLTSRQCVYLPIIVLYGISVVVLGWDKIILTESLSLSLTVFMIFGLVYYLKDNKLRYLGVAVAAAGIGAFMRSVFAIYAGVILGFLIIRLIFTGKKSSEEKKIQRITDAKGIIFAVIPVLFLLGYGALFSMQYGAFTLSDSGLGQQLSIVLENDYYLDSTDEELKSVAKDILSGKIPESYNGKIEDLISEIYGDSLTDEQIAEIKENVVKYLDEDDVLAQNYIDALNEFYSELYGNGSTASSYGNVYRARCYIMDNYDRERINAFVEESKRANYKEYVVSLRFGTFETFGSGYERVKDGKISAVMNILLKRVAPSVNVYLLQGILMGVVELIVYIVVVLRKKYSSWIHLGFATMILATGLLSVLGTNAEFVRTALTMYPMLYVVFAMWANSFVELVVLKEHKRDKASNISSNDDFAKIEEKG